MVLSIALAVSTGGIVAASAGTGPTTTTATPPVPPSTTPPTTVAALPPPPPFPLGDDFGRLMLLHKAAAVAAFATATNDIAASGDLVTQAQDHVKVAQRAEAEVHQHAIAVEDKLATMHEQVKALAVEAYMTGTSVQLTGALSSFASARDIVDLQRNLTLVHSSNDALLQLVTLEQQEQRRVAGQISAAAKATATAIDKWHAAMYRLGDAQQRRAQAIADIARAARDQVRFFADATTSASPIMGPSLLTADDLVAYIASLGLHPKLTVPLHTLAEWYISEGAAEGVRGDVAFAQSILETGAFMFPGHGLLVPGDNNFAGIDACDSCKHGDRFASAHLGVRAQIQLLRVYSDPSLQKITDLAHGLALLHEPKLGFSGHVQTWYALGSHWATGANYGFHIYDIYLKMVTLARRSGSLATAA